MTIVVNSGYLQEKFKILGWSNLSLSEIDDWLKSTSITAAELVAYLNALEATPGGVNDQTIPGCSSTKANQITAALKAKGVALG